MDRPKLNKNLDSKIFLSFYYLKEELVDFLRENNLPTLGGKAELTERISHFLDTGEILYSKKRITNKKTDKSLNLTEKTKIEDNFVCSQKHRLFFKEKIGDTFSFNVKFQKWLKSNAGKTYQDAIDAYYEILKEKKESKNLIDKQFEYNRYIRDFFENNEGKSLSDAIQCWKYKRSLKGHNRYEPSDLKALK